MSIPFYQNFIIQSSWKIESVSYCVTIWNVYIKFHRSKNGRFDPTLNDPQSSAFKDADLGHGLAIHWGLELVRFQRSYDFSDGLTGQPLDDILLKHLMIQFIAIAAVDENKVVIWSINFLLSLKSFVRSQPTLIGHWPHVLECHAMVPWLEMVHHIWLRKSMNFNSVVFGVSVKMNSHSSWVHPQTVDNFVTIVYFGNQIVVPINECYFKRYAENNHPIQWSGHIEAQPHILQSAAWIWTQTSSNVQDFFHQTIPTDSKGSCCWPVKTVSLTFKIDIAFPETWFDQLVKSKH